MAPCRVSEEGGCPESQLKGWAVFLPVLPGRGMGCSDPVDQLCGEPALWRERWDTAQLPQHWCHVLWKGEGVTDTFPVLQRQLMSTFLGSAVAGRWWGSVQNFSDWAAGLVGRL